MVKESIRQVVRFADFFVDDTKSGVKIPQSKYASQGRNVIIDQGDNNVAGYSDSDDGLYTSVPVIVFGDHTRIVKYVDRPFFIGADGVKILKPQNGVNPLYAFYALKAAHIDSLGYSRHFKLVKELTFALADVRMQERIAATLDRICELKKNAETRLAKLDLLVESRFVEMFGDVCRNSKHFPMLRGKDAFIFSSGKFLESEKRKTSGVPVYGGNGIAWYTDYPLVCKPTIVLGRVGAYCGNARLVTQPAWITDNAIYIKDFRRNDFDIVFLAYYMQVLNFAKYAAKSGQPKITQRPLEATCYIIPPVHLQREFAAFVEKVEKLKEIAKRSAEQMDVLYRSKLQEYFG